MSVRPITDTLRHIGGGVFIDTASDKLSELVAAVDSSGKAGRIDLTISVKKATRGGAMHITGKVKLTKPAEEPMEAMLWFMVAVLMVIVATYLLFIAGSVAFCRLMQKKKSMTRLWKCTNNMHLW